MKSLIRSAGEFLDRRPAMGRLLVAGLWIGGLGALWLGTLAVQSWAYYQGIGRRPYRTSHFRIAAKKAVSTVLAPYYDRRLEDEGLLPAYELTLSEKRLAEWNQMLERVYARGFAQPEDQTYLPAVFRHRDFEAEVDVRGRGTLFTHYKPAKPSFRVRFPKDRFFRGRRVTNLIIPYDQARVVGDTTLNGLARRYGLVTLPTRFVTLRLNGKMLGVYHEVEHFRKELAVLQFRSEGFFMSSLGEGKGGSEPGDHPGFARALEAFSSCVVRRCEPEQVREVLDTYVDREKMAIYTAMTTLFGAKHGWGEDNLILFFDPPRGRLEPVPWDMGTLRLGKGEDPFAGLESVKGIGEDFLRFDDFRLERDRWVWDMIRRHRESTLEDSNRLFEDIRPALDLDTEHSRRYTRRMVDYFQGALKHNFKLWEEHLEAVDLAVYKTERGPLLVNRAAAAVEVSWEDAAGEGRTLRVPGRYLDRPGRLFLPSEAAADPSTWTLHNGVTGREIGASAVVRAEGEPDPGRPDDRAADDEHADPAPERVPPTTPAGVRIVGGPEAPEWIFEGNVRLDETLVVPEGSRARFAPGLRLVLGRDVSLFIHGDLTSVGTTERPIWVGSENLESPFHVVAVLGRSHRKARVRLEHTTIRGGTEALYRGSYFTGMFSVYDGHLMMKNSRIEDVLGEDGLNVKFGLVEMRDNVLERTHSDAVDLDFCRGVMERNVIRAAGGDALDFSGSLVLARDNVFEEITDKAFSAGEATTARLVGNRIHGATTGAASKDSSWIAVEPGESRNVRIGTAIYQKKQIFDSGVAILSEPVEGTETRYLLDPGAWAHVAAPDR